MKPILQEFAVRFQYPVHFTANVFAPENEVLAEILRGAGPGRHKILCIVDEGVASTEPNILKQIEGYHLHYRDTMTAVCPPLVIPGGELAKNSLKYVDLVQEAIHRSEEHTSELQ